MFGNYSRAETIWGNTVFLRTNYTKSMYNSSNSWCNFVIFLLNWRDYEWALKISISLTEVLVFKKNCMSSKEKTLRVTRLTGKVMNIKQAYNAINCQVETRGYYSQFIDSFSLQISLTTSATVATSNYFVSTRLKFEALAFIHHYFIPIILV